MFAPKNLFINKDVENSPFVKQIKERVQKLNPAVKISIVDSIRPEYSNSDNYAERFHEMKDTLFLCNRSSSYIETFASPGRIVEGPGTMVKTLMNCSGGCHYCYLNRTALRQQWQKVYVNLEMLEQEMINEVPIRAGLMTILSAYSIYEEETIVKIPDGFKILADRMRNTLSSCGKKKVTDTLVFEYLKNNLPDILTELGCEADPTKLSDLQKSLSTIFSNNQKLSFSQNVSEYSDILGIEHITGHLDYILGIVERNKSLKIHLFTKFGNIDTLLKHNGDNRVRVVMNYNPQSIIDAYEPGTSSLSERIEAHAALQAKGGYNTVVLIEPIMMYKGYIPDYIQLLRDIFKKVDPNNLEKIALGMVRYSPQLITIIENLYPDSDIFENKDELIKPVESYDRYRYDFDERVSCYKQLIEEIRKHTNCPITLGAENPEVWEALQLDSKNFLSNEFYQI